jgi:hypothetical protein
MTPLFCADGGWEDDLEKRELRLFQGFLASFTDRCPPHEFFNYPSMATLRVLFIKMFHFQRMLSP